MRQAAVEMLSIVEAREKRLGRPAENDDDLLFQMYLLVEYLGDSRKAAARKLTKDLPESLKAVQKRLERKYPTFAEWLESLSPRGELP